MSDRNRLLWVSAAPDGPGAIERRLLLGAIARGDVELLAAGLPPGEAPVEIGSTTITGRGVDWVPRRPIFGSVPAARQVERVGRLYIGRSHPHRRMSDRDHELANAVVDSVATGAYALVVCTDVGVAARIAGIDVPVIAVALDDAGDAREPGGLRARLEAAERVVRDRRDRRALRRAAAARPRRDLEAIVGGGDTDVDAAFAAQLATTWNAAGQSAVRAQAAPAESPLPRASVVVPTAGRSELLRETAAALIDALKAAPGTELIIVQQGGRDVAEIFGHDNADVEVIRDSGVGASRARNVGAARARGEIVLFTDDDCVVPSSWVLDHARALADERIAASFGAVTGLSRHGDGEDAVLRRRRFASGSYPWHVGHGSNLAVRRRVLLEIGGWDERLGPGTAIPAGEDADLIVRILAQHTVETGIGRPVVHLDWRSREQNERNLRAYEHGAGAWIGKAVRRHDPRARQYLRGRWRLLVHRLSATSGVGRRALVTYRTATPFARGFLAGWRLPTERSGR